MSEKRILTVFIPGSDPYEAVYSSDQFEWKSIEQGLTVHSKATQQLIAYYRDIPYSVTMCDKEIDE